MKAKITSIALLTTLAFSAVLNAEEISLPVISKPAALEEGIQRDLSASQIEELLPWAKDSKIFLVDLLENVQGLPMTDKVDRLVDGIKQVVGESSSKNTELFMRYALNRAIVLNDVLTKEITAESVGLTDVKARVLVMSINMAIKHYDTDLAKMSKKTVPDYAQFGIEYFTFLKELNKSIFDATAQYAIERTSLEWLQWDLYRDLNNTKYAPQIVKINNALKTFPTSRMSDAQSLNYIRQIRKVSEQLKFVERKQDSSSQSENENTEIYNDKITVGSRVIDSGNYVGTVKSIFENGTVTITFDWDGYSALETRKINTLSPSIKCYSNKCVGDKIVDNGGYTGVIQLVFANGKARAKFDGYSASENRMISNMWKETNCYGNICANDRVIDSGGYIGTVKRVFENGEARVIFDGYGALEKRLISNLSKQVK